MHQRALRPLMAASLLMGLLGAVWVYDPAEPPTEAQADVLAGLQCEAIFDPGTIETGTVHEEVHVAFTEVPGEIEAIHVDSLASLDVLWTHDDDEDPTGARVRISALRAEIGDWNVVFQGVLAVCDGVVSVVEGS